MSALAWTSSASASVTTDPREVEAKVLAALNDARSNPQAYIANLEGYRRQFEGKIVRLPGSRLTYRTREGTVPVDEAVDYLASRKGRVELRETSVLAAAAADHVAEQSRSGGIGHYSANGSGPGDRAIRRGGGKMVAEVIAYGAYDPLDVIRQLIVDDGVPDRGHRTALFATQLRYAGVACGPHPTYRTICVIDMAETPDGRP